MVKNSVKETVRWNIMVGDVRMLVQATCDFYYWLSAAPMQETGNNLIIVCDSLSSCNAWRDLLLTAPQTPSPPTMFIQPANHVMSVTRHTSKINTGTLHGQTLEVLIQGTL